MYGFPYGDEVEESFGNEDLDGLDLLVDVADLFPAQVCACGAAYVGNADICPACAFPGLEVES